MRPLLISLLLAASPAFSQTTPPTDADFARAVEAIRELTKRPFKLAPMSRQPAAPAVPVVNRTVDLVTRFPQLRACEAAAAKAPTYYGGWSLWLLTDAAAYYYHEDCDICAAVDRCELLTGAMTEWKSAHSVSCGEAAPLKQGRQVLYDCR